MSTSRPTKLTKAQADLRTHALGYPDAVEEFPWGHSAIKVKGKIFLSTYLDEKNGVLGVSMKLPVSNGMALTLPFAAPTAYGLGKSGWVTAKFNAGDVVPTEMLMEWVDESYRAIAPKRLVAQLEGEQEPAEKPQRKKRRG